MEHILKGQLQNNFDVDNGVIPTIVGSQEAFLVLFVVAKDGGLDVLDDVSRDGSMTPCRVGRARNYPLQCRTLDGVQPR